MGRGFKEGWNRSEPLGMRNFTAEATTPTAKDVIVSDVFTKVDLIPSHIDLFTIDLDLGGAAGRELKLRKALKPVLDHYDIVVIDCPPNLTIPTQNALATSTHFVVPISPDFLSSIGIALLLSRIKKNYAMTSTIRLCTLAL
jgi:chromosome partitioning protein